MVPVGKLLVALKTDNRASLIHFSLSLFFSAPVPCPCASAEFCHLQAL